MATSKKGAAKKATTAGRKYSPAASESVEREMKAMKEGTLKSGSGETVTNPKQAIAIGLSEARRAGAKMPPAPGQAADSGPAPASKKAAKKSAKKAAAKKRASA